jgi:DNA-3-methyladenine glycosylase I
MRDYHDSEWGRPLRDERSLYEKLCLECMQSGLSWAIVLKKRESMRAAFAGFEPDAVARFGRRDVERLLEDPGIIRNRRKVEAVVANARATVAMRETPAPLSELVWSFRPEPAPAPTTFAEMASLTPESTALSKALKQRGFVFVGPTTVYSTMQAVGLVNDHLAGCFVREEVKRAQEHAHGGR